MGQKVHPNGIRLGIVKPWNSTWFANTKEFADNLDSDFKVRQFLTRNWLKLLYLVSLSSVRLRASV
jgi:small subunit ribosomal protein S3